MIKTHGMSGTRFYRIWAHIVQRITNPKATKYHNYGGRGIGISKEWLDFKNFYRDMYEGYEAHRKANNYTSIDRIDNDKGYSKENCRWATMLEQNRNQRTTRFLMGEPITAMSSRLGGYPDLIRFRLRRGWSPEKAAAVVLPTTCVKCGGKMERYSSTQKYCGSIKKRLGCSFEVSRWRMSREPSIYLQSLNTQKDE